MVTSAPGTGERLHYSAVQEGDRAVLVTATGRMAWEGQWIDGSPWARFGRYDHYVVVRGDGASALVPAHAGELVPGSTEDLVATIRRYDPERGYPPAPMTLELDPTWRCSSVDCGGHCFSAPYRRRAPRATIRTEILSEVIRAFAEAGGRIVRFDGGGDPLLHPSVRDGSLPVLAHSLGLKSTILTSGDLLERAELGALIAARCYLRISLNAARQATRSAFHGNRVDFARLLSRIKAFVRAVEHEGVELPVGATYLLGASNYAEVAECAARARDVGVRHFSVRRVLGPPDLRGHEAAIDSSRLIELFAEIQAMASDDFRVFLPWRAVTEADQAPSEWAFSPTRCWQSTLKVVVEPTTTGSARAQLCGRYRGGGVGQRMQLPPLFDIANASDWLHAWRRSFDSLIHERTTLPRRCVSCIDRGFMRMAEAVLAFVGMGRQDFEVLHLDRGGGVRVTPAVGRGRASA